MFDLFDLFSRTPLIRALRSASSLSASSLEFFWFALALVALICVAVGWFIFVSTACTYKKHPEDICGDAKWAIILVAIGILMFSLGDKLLYPIVVLFVFAACWLVWKTVLGIFVSCRACMTKMCDTSNR